MQAIQFQATIGRYLTGLALRKVYPGILLNGLSCTSKVETDEPTLPASDWVKIKTRYSGICGSDMKSIYLDVSLYYSPVASDSFILGHENMGSIVEAGTKATEWGVGDRIVVEPTLWCRPRGIAELCPNCARGETNRCLNLTAGALSPGLHIGACAETGGGWSPYFVAHKSQLYHLPEHIDDENAVLIEPFACAIHAALANFPEDDETVLIIGAGTIGLCTVAALRALGSTARLILVTRYPYQAQAGLRLGADKVVVADDAKELYLQVGQLTAGQVKSPLLGKQIMLGGADLTFDCVGSQDAIDDALRLTRNGGRVSILGAPGELKKLDWTALHFQELQVHGAYIFNHAEKYAGKTRNTFDIAIDLMASGKVDLAWLVSHRFALDDYKKAIKSVEKKSRHQLIKAVFEFT